MSPTALALVLIAAVAHAGWNLLAKQAGVAGAAFVWPCGLVAIGLYGPVALVALALDPGAISRAGVGFMAGSGLVHAGYFLVLQRGYEIGDLSFVYPLARGTGPLLSVLVAVLVLGERPGALALCGAALIVAAVLSLAGGPPHPGRSGSGSRSGVGFALMTGALIAVYTVWDAHAVGTLDQPPLPYYVGTELARALVLAPLALRDRPAIASAWRSHRRAIAGVGALSPLAYLLVLVAFTMAPVSYVAPAREASVVLGALLGVSVLGEGDARRRLIAAGAIAAGIVALAVG